MFVNAAPPHPSAARFALIIEGLCLAVAACGGRGRLAGPLVVRLWSRLRHLAVRFAVLAARAAEPGAGASPRAARGTRRPPDTTSQDTAPRRTAPPPARLPGGFAWLLPLAPDAAASGSQLQALLAEPEMAALLAAEPLLARMLRPLCRMLGVVPPAVAGPGDPAPARAARAPRPPRPKTWRLKRRSDLLFELRMGKPLIVA